MYPYLFGKIPSYSVMMIIGMISAILLFRILCTKNKISNNVYDYYSTAALIAIAVGLGSAFLFQAVYNLISTGIFKIQGLTFMGGLIGGSITFVLFGLITRNPERKSAFLPVAELGVPCLIVAHAIGRIGCFLAGCCYGRESEYGIYMPEVGVKVIPTQLIESAFLFVLFGVVLFFTLSHKVKGFNLVTYAVCYSIFRFILEFFRDDYRGSFIPGISPSQFQSIVLFVVGVALLVLRIKKPSLFALPDTASASVPEPDSVTTATTEIDDNDNETTCDNDNRDNSDNSTNDITDDNKDA